MIGRGKADGDEGTGEMLGRKYRKQRNTMHRTLCILNRTWKCSKAGDPAVRGDGAANYKNVSEQERAEQTRGSTAENAFKSTSGLFSLVSTLI